MSAGYTGKVHSESARQCVLGTLKTLNKAQRGLKRTEWQSWVIKRGGDILIHPITTSGQDQESGRSSVQEGLVGRKPHQGRAEVESWPGLWTRGPTLQG